MAPSSEVICILSDDEEGAAKGSQLPSAPARAQPVDVVNLISSSDNSKSEGQRQTVSHLAATPHRLRMLLPRWRQQGREGGQDATTPACSSNPDPGFAVELSDVEELDMFERRRPSDSSREGSQPALGQQHRWAQQQERRQQQQQQPRARHVSQAAHCHPREGCGDSGGGTNHRCPRQQQSHSHQVQSDTAGDLSKSKDKTAGSASKSALLPSSSGKHPAGAPGPPGAVKLPPLLLRLRRQQSQSPLQGPSSSMSSGLQQRGGRQGQPRPLGSSRALKAQQKACEVAKQQSQSSSPAESAPAKPAPAAVQGTQARAAVQQQQQRENGHAGGPAAERLPAQHGPTGGSRRPATVLRVAEWVKAALNGKPSKCGIEAKEGTPSIASAQERYLRPLPAPPCDRGQLGSAVAEPVAQEAAAPDVLAAAHPVGVAEAPAAGSTGPASIPATKGLQRQEGACAPSAPSPCTGPGSQCPAPAALAEFAAQPARPFAGPLGGDAMDLDVEPLAARTHTRLPRTSAGAELAAGPGEEGGGGRQLRKRKPKQEEASSQGLAKRLRRREASAQQLPPWAQRRSTAPNFTSLLLAAAARQPPLSWLPNGAGPCSGGGSSSAAGGKPMPGWVALQHAARCPGFHVCRDPDALHQHLLGCDGANPAGAGSAAAVPRQQPGAPGATQMSLPQAFDRLLASAAASAGAPHKPQSSALDQLRGSLSLPPAAIQQHLKAALLAEGLLLAQVAPALGKAAAAKHAAAPLAKGRPPKRPHARRAGPPGPSLLGVRPPGIAAGTAAASPSSAARAGAGQGSLGGPAIKHEGQSAEQPGAKPQAGHAPSKLQRRPPKCPPKPSAPGGSSSAPAAAAAATPAAAAAPPERRWKRPGAGFAGPREQGRADIAAAAGGGGGKGKAKGAAGAGCKFGSLKQLSKRKDIQSFHPAVPPLSYLPRQYNS